MIIVGVDYHPSVQQVAFLDTETGETGERRLNHSDGEAERFIAIYGEDRSRCVGIEATGHARWFERLLAELKFELWIGIRPGSRQHGYASKRPTGRMLSYCLGYWQRVAFPRSGSRVRRTVIYAS